MSDNIFMGIASYVRWLLGLSEQFQKVDTLMRIEVNFSWNWPSVVHENNVTPDRWTELVTRGNMTLCIKWTVSILELHAWSCHLSSYALNQESSRHVSEEIYFMLHIYKVM